MPKKNYLYLPTCIDIFFIWEKRLAKCNYLQRKSGKKTTSDLTPSRSYRGDFHRFSGIIWLFWGFQIYKGSHASQCKADKKKTWTGEAAVNKPATPPPKTLPSGPARDTLRPPVRLRWPPVSDRRNDPDSDNISNRPCIYIVYMYLDTYRTIYYEQ